MGWDGLFTRIPYGSFWRAHRRLFHGELEMQTKGPAWYHVHQIRGVHDLLFNLLETPDRWVTHLRQ